MNDKMGTLIAFVILSALAINVSAIYDHYRLPTSIQPERYKLKIITYLENPNNSSFEGQVSITFQVLEPTSNITLHARNLKIDETLITLRSLNDDKFEYCEKGIESVPKYDYYIIQLCEPLQKDEIYTVKIHFSGVLTENLQGYYRSSYVDKETHEKRWLSVTQFEPTSARSAFPCFDEPNYKAKFTIWMGHNKSLTAISNMPLKTKIPLNGTENFVWSLFEESVPMSTYLVAYSVNDFAYISSPPTEGSGVVFRTWFQKALIDQCIYASEVGPKVLKYFEESFGIEFPLPKVDAIAIPDFASGAMENWGLITYRESALLYSPNISTEYNKARIVNVIAHELAHQWFGNLVTMKWWSDLWLNEGFATYVSGLGVHNLNPEWDYYNKENFNNMLTIFWVDMKQSSHPISQPISDLNDIRNRFDSISYNKGSGVLRMLHMFMGNEGFFEAVRFYLESHKYQNAEQDDLWAAFTKMAHKYQVIKSEYDIKTIMDSWTLQSGYPLIKVTRDYSSGKVYITQQRYMESPEISEEESKKCWWVPLTYTTASEFDFETTTPKAWLECNQTKQNLTLDYVTSGDEWILFNLQFAGIYRVMYDKENWSLLKDALMSDRFSDIHVLNRAQLINDALNLAWTGHQDYEVAFDILEYLRQEREFLPWGTALQSLGNLKYLLEPFEEQTKYIKLYLGHIIRPLYYELGGLNDTVIATNNTYSAIMFKGLIARMACTLDQKDCITTAKNYFQQWKSSDNPSLDNKIPVNLRTTVYCVALRHGTEEDWQFLWERFTESNVAAEQKILLGSMTCIRNETILENFINLAFDKSGVIRKGEAVTVLGGVALNKIGFPVAFEYFVQNMNYLKEFYGPQFSVLCQLMEIFSRSILTPKAVESFQHLIEDQREYFSQCPSNIKTALEIIDVNMKWIERNVEKIKDHLEARLNSMGIKVEKEEKKERIKDL